MKFDKKKKNKDDLGLGNIRSKKFKRPSVKGPIKPKTRKELRKQKRKDKKAKKHEFLIKVKCKKSIISADDKLEDDKTKKKSKTQENQKPNSNQNSSKKVPSTRDKRKKIERDFRQSEIQLKKEMEEVRRKRLLEDNIEEDHAISKLEKKLKLNKKAIIPESFRTDGLDYLLEIVSSKKDKKSKKDKTSQEINDSEEEMSDRSLEDDEDDFGDDMNSGSDNEDFTPDDDDDGKEDANNNDENVSFTKIKTKKKVQKKTKPVSEDEEEESYSEEDEDEDPFGIEKEMSEDFDSDEREKNTKEINEDDDMDESNEPGEKSKKTLKKNDGIWEDIYGRLRSSDGSVIDDKTMKPKVTATTSIGAKYVPPGKRGEPSSRDKIIKTLKGLLNRLSESNIHGISQQIEGLYMSSSRNEMNEALLHQFYQSLVATVTMSERIILEHIMLITILHANVGSEVGAFFIQHFLQKFRALHTETENLEDDKQLCNLALLISSMYHFKIVGSRLIFDLLNFLANGFESKDIEIILIILKSIGFRLRKDDPLQLKNLILLLHQQANSTAQQANSRVKFMLDILLAIKNNNMNKIPNYDPSYGEHLLKMLKQHFHKGNYVTELMINMEDLLNADTKGRWWVVGSAWTNEQKSSDVPKEGNTISSTASSEINEKLLAKAKKFGMNTDTRKTVFSIIMTAEDYLDAFEKLIHLGLKNQQEREIIHVIVYCCLHENNYNPYYGLILSKLCSTDRRFMYTTSFKLEIVEWAKNLGQRKASRLFCISQRRIYEWMKLYNIPKDVHTPSLSSSSPIMKKRTEELHVENDCMESTSKRQCLGLKKDMTATHSCITSDHSGESTSSISLKSSRQVLDINVEKNVYSWIQSLNYQPTSSEIRKKAVEIYRSSGYNTIQCSYGWYRRFSMRFKLESNTHEPSDSIILSWLLEQYDNNNIVTYSDVQDYAKESLAHLRPNFVASNNWLVRFFKRHHVLINWDGFIEDSLPGNLQQKTSDFFSKLSKDNVFQQFGASQIGCMDEIPLSFTCSAPNKKDHTEEVTRVKKISVKNCEATVLLSLRADGYLLPPMIVVKGQTLCSLNQVYAITDNPVVVFYAEESTEPTLTTLEKWLDLVWLKHVQQPSLLFTDSYELHHQLQAKCTELGIRQEIFPAGCSTKLQPINVYARKTFQKLIENSWDQYLKKHNIKSKTKLPTSNEMIEWIHDAYMNMKLENHQMKLVTSFDKVGLSLRPNWEENS